MVVVVHAPPRPCGVTPKNTTGVKITAINVENENNDDIQKYYSASFSIAMRQNGGKGLLSPHQLKTTTNGAVVVSSSPHKTVSEIIAQSTTTNMYIFQNIRGKDCKNG